MVLRRAVVVGSSTARDATLGAAVAYLAGCTHIVAACILKSFQWTVQYGMSEETPTIFARLGLWLTNGLGAFQEGRKYCAYGLRFHDRIPSKRSFCRSHHLIFGMVWHFTELFSKDYLQELRLGFEAGTIAGFSSSTCWAKFFYLEYVSVSLLVGRMLVSLCSLGTK